MAPTITAGLKQKPRFKLREIHVADKVALGWISLNTFVSHYYHSTNDPYSSLTYTCIPLCPDFGLSSFSKPVSLGSTIISSTKAQVPPTILRRGSSIFWSMLCSHNQAHLYVTYTHVTNSIAMITAYDYINI